MVQMPPSVRAELKKLKKISYSLIRNQSAGVINIRIRDLSHKDLSRALYVATSAFAELSQKYLNITKVIYKVQEDIKKVLDNKKLSKQEVIDQIKKITLDDPIVGEHPSKPDSSSDKES